MGALYRYFDGKQALLAALQQRAVSAFDDWLAKAIAEVDDPMEQLAASWTAWRAFATEHPELHGLIDAALSDPRQLLDDEQALAVQRTLEPVLDRVATAIARAQAAGSLSRPGTHGSVRTPCGRRFTGSITSANATIACPRISGPIASQPSC